ncbi:MAG: hypothetical protein AMJ89_03135, partial [candidate division Zixibacteria bacterium SM23_73]
LLFSSFWVYISFRIISGNAKLFNKGGFMSKRFSLILFLAIVIVLLAVLPTLAESVDTAWVRTYNGPANGPDYATGIAVDRSGDVYVTGYSYNPWGTPYYECTTIKYYSNGDTAWLVRRGNERGLDIVVDDPGNVYVTGLSWWIFYDYLTIKHFPDGDTAWVRIYSVPGCLDDLSWAIALDDSGNVYVTGYTEYFNFESWWHDYVTIKYYPEGDTAWARRDTQGYAYAIEVDDAGNVYVTGYWTTIKYDAGGNRLWVGSWGGVDISVDDSGNVYVTGSTEGSGTDYDYTTIKYFQNGDTAWVRGYNGPANSSDKAQALAVDGSGNVYVTGGSSRSLGPPYNTYDFATIKYYPNGDTAWVRRYNGPGNGNDVARAIAVDDSGNVYVTGTWATIKYDADGDQLWIGSWGGVDIVLDSSNNVYVTGGGSDYATIKYVQTTDVKDETESREKPSEFTLSQNYPNPFNQATKIEFTLAKSGFVSLSIYDILGRKVKTLVSERVSSGYKSVLWEGKNDSGKDVASGIYFYQMRVEDPASGEVGDFSETRKLVLLK